MLRCESPHRCKCYHQKVYYLKKKIQFFLKMGSFFKDKSQITSLFFREISIHSRETMNQCCSNINVFKVELGGKIFARCLFLDTR